MAGLSFTISDVVAIVGTAAAFVVWFWRMQREFHGRINRLRDDLNQHKLFVAQQYVSTESLVRTEERLIMAINGLASKIDRITEGR